MNRRSFLMNSAAVIAGPLSIGTSNLVAQRAMAATAEPRVAVLLIDTERTIGSIDERIYGHFLEEINHSAVDGLYAEQIRGCGFEGKDFETYWEPFSERGGVENADIDFRNGKKSVRLKSEGGRAGIRQGRIYVVAGQTYDGSLWVRREGGSPRLALRVVDSKGAAITSLPLAPAGSSWQELSYSFSSSVTDTHASVELVPGLQILHRSNVPTPLPQSAGAWITPENLPWTCSRTRSP